jgi:hypothetical protein
VGHGRAYGSGAVERSLAGIGASETRALTDSP